MANKICEGCSVGAARGAGAVDTVVVLGAVVVVDVVSAVSADGTSFFRLALAT